MLPLSGSPHAPKYWRNESSGELAGAVLSYLDDPDAMTVREIALMRAYLCQWIDSPVWKMNPLQSADSRAAIDMLRATAARIATPGDISRWLRHALDEAIDPL